MFYLFYLFFISHFSRNEDATLDSVLSVAVVSGEPCTRYVHINMHNIQDLNKPRDLVNGHVTMYVQV